MAVATPVLPDPASLSLAEQVAQMVTVRTTGHLFDHEIRYPAWEADQATLAAYVQELGIGGVILLGGSAAEVGVRSQTLQTVAPIPLLIAADIEEGVGQRFSGATWFPPPMALASIAQNNLPQALTYAEEMGTATAQEALAIGLNWVLAPVVDVNNNPQNPVINVRAFGHTPNLVSQLSRAFIQGAQRHPVLTTAKHFPGHGDTDTDSHLTLPVLPHSVDRLRQVELAPFRQAIAAGVDAIMTAHLLVPALDGTYPATLSAAILTRLLRQEMGFDGLIVTDALIMGAISQHYGPHEAAVLAVEAGADVLLMPTDPEAVVKAVCEAVAIGRLSAERIQTSVERLWRAKQKTASLLAVPPESCHAWEHIPPPPVRLEHLAQPSARQIQAQVLEAAMTIRGRIAGHPAIPPGGPLQSHGSPALPGEDTGKKRVPESMAPKNIVIVDDVVACPFLRPTAAAIVLPQKLGYQLELVDSHGCQHFPGVETPISPSLLQLFIRGNPFRGSAGVTDLAEGWLKDLLQHNCLAGLVIYGSPYALEQLLPYLPDIVPYGFTYGQMPEAQTVLLKALLMVPEADLITGSAFTD